MIEKVGGVGGPEPIKGMEGRKVEKSKRREVEGESLSAQASEIVKKAVEKAKDIEEIREKLVEEIKKAIESGKYIPDIENIARRMLGGI